MRLLLIHSDYIEYEAKKKTKMAEAKPIQSSPTRRPRPSRYSVPWNRLMKTILKAWSCRLSRRSTRPRTR